MQNNARFCWGFEEDEAHFWLNLDAGSFEGNQEVSFLNGFKTFFKLIQSS